MEEAILQTKLAESAAAVSIPPSVPSQAPEVPTGDDLELARQTEEAIFQSVIELSAKEVLGPQKGVVIAEGQPKKQKKAGPVDESRKMKEVLIDEPTSTSSTDSGIPLSQIAPTNYDPRA